MRLFIALPLPLSIKEELSRAQDRFKQFAPAAGWVRPDNLHITLKFLGDTDNEQAEKIKLAMTKTADEFDQITAVLSEFGFFPSQHRPKVFFAATDQQTQLQKIAFALEKNLAGLGFTEEQRFVSHITLCRIKNAVDVEALAAEIKKVKLTGSFSVKEIALVKSTLKSRGPEYQTVFSVQLKTA